MNGRNSDGGNWSQSRLKNGLEKNTLNLPDPTLLPGRNYPLSYVCTGDDAFPLNAYMMKPYPQNNLSLEKRIFNYRLSRMRRISENAFGILEARQLHLLRLRFTTTLERSPILAKYIFHQH